MQVLLITALGTLPKPSNLPKSPRGAADRQP